MIVLTRDSLSPVIDKELREITKIIRDIMLPICIRILSQKTKKGISPSEEFCIIIVGSPDQNTYSFVSDFLLFDASKRWQDSAQRSKGPPILLNC